MTARKIAWHYTINDRAVHILKDGIIRAATANVPANETPIVWFSTRQHWEPTANKAMIDDSGNVSSLTMQETIQLGGGAWRFGLDTEKLIYYRKIIQVANITRRMAKALEQTALDAGADPTCWWGAIEPVNVSDCIVEQLDGDNWVTPASDSL